LKEVLVVAALGAVIGGLGTGTIMDAVAQKNERIQAVKSVTSDKSLINNAVKATIMATETDLKGVPIMKFFHDLLNGNLPKEQSDKAFDEFSKKYSTNAYDMFIKEAQSLRTDSSIGNTYHKDIDYMINALKRQKAENTAANTSVKTALSGFTPQTEFIVPAGIKKTTGRG
jgi:hypothetical protein